MSSGIKQFFILLWALLFLGFVLLLFKFYRLQVVEHESWLQKAKNQHTILIREFFQRGRIYASSPLKPGIIDSKTLLARDVPISHLYADPKAIPDEHKKEIVAAILRYLSPDIHIAQKLKSELHRKSRSRRLVSCIEEEEKLEFLSWWRSFAKAHSLPSNALFFIQDYKRVHPQGRLLGQVVHTVQDRRDEKTFNSIPTGGIELSMNRYLEGKMGLKRMARSPRHLLETGEIIEKAQDGIDIELTIDPVIQAIAEEELEKASLLFKTKSAWAVMINPRTGHIIALAQYPFFNPDEYKRFFIQPQMAQESKVKAITDTNEPGSPTKAITIALALKANAIQKAQGKKPLFSPFEKIPTSNGSFPGRKKAITDVSFHKFLNMYMGAQRSSNIYMATLAGRVVDALGDEWYRNELSQSFGFGMKTGIELPGESAGVLPMPGKKHPNGRAEWSKATPFSLAMGYNLQVTSLQMARAYCVFASGGYLPDLTLIRRVFRTKEDGSLEILVDNTSVDRRSTFKKVLDESINEEVIRALKFVTKPRGSASKADIFGFTEVGKTGTSMKLVNGAYTDKKHYASFAGFAPASNPQFVLLVGLDEPAPGYIPGRGLNHRGGTCAAPTFRCIATRVLEYLGTTPDDPYGYPKGDPRSDLTQADWMKETEALQKLYEQWNGQK